MSRKIFMLLIAFAFIAGISRLTYAQTHSGHNQESVSVAASKEVVNVGNKICPVSGEKVGEGGMEPATYEYKGKIYNFCCPDCVEKFKKEPEKYIKKIEDELKAESAQKTQEETAAAGHQMHEGMHQGHHH